MIGAKEYDEITNGTEKIFYRSTKNIDQLFTPSGENKNSGLGWKVGAFEPSVPYEHGDIEYLYTLDLDKKQITYKDLGNGKTHKVK